uniref:Uncharacterized protein n=1 Tax=Riboviria sp. TaxID=2585031 RepID=A0A514D9D2_9VIRU|nr:MAG: hypothetical protein H4Bulk46291_000003 [Riboviria sp.]
MPYTNYGVKHETLEALRWVTVGNLQNMLAALDKIQFAYQTQRSQGLQLATSLESKTEFFDKNTRFPPTGADGKTFKAVCIDCGDWPFKFNQVITALNYKTPDVSQTNKDLAINSKDYQSNASSGSKTKATSSGDNDDSTKSITSMDERVRFEKSMLAFTTGITDIRNQLRGAIKTQAGFEAENELVWKTS